MISSAKAYDGRKALLIGASEGIGLALAGDLARRGADVVITSRDSKKLDAAKELVCARRARDTQLVEASAFDVSDAAAADSALTALTSAFGTPDYLIVCAGFSHPAYFEDLTLDHHRAMMDVNYFGTVHAVRSIAPAMLKRGHGHIVTTASGLGFLGLFGFTAYCATKFAVVGYSEALRSEFHNRGVRVSCFCPPAVATPGFDRENAIKPKEVAAAEARASVLKADDVAAYLLDRLPKNPFLVIPGAEMRFYHRAHRLLPGIVRHFSRGPKR